jgi:hypothetical protein
MRKAASRKLCRTVTDLVHRGDRRCLGGRDVRDAKNNQGRDFEGEPDGPDDL